MIKTSSTWICKKSSSSTVFDFSVLPGERLTVFHVFDIAEPCLFLLVFFIINLVSGLKVQRQLFGSFSWTNDVFTKDFFVRRRGVRSFCFFFFPIVFFGLSKTFKSIFYCIKESLNLFSPWIEEKRHLQKAFLSSNLLDKSLLVFEDGTYTHSDCFSNVRGLRRYETALVANKE